jgi:SpoVK/Ycf46/Vps4 family AAA+-type ATPase
LQIPVLAPDQRAAREIFEIHLDDVPFHQNGHPGSETRRAIIDRAVSLFYNPNEVGSLCTVKFRDGTQRIITARDLVSGRVFEQACRKARWMAASREGRGGEAGLTVQDIEDAVADAKRKLGASLTRHNVHQYVLDLRSDMEVVGLETTTRRIDRPYRYFIDNEELGDSNGATE